jgi:hypothetical protein
MDRGHLYQVLRSILHDNQPSNPRSTYEDSAYSARVNSDITPKLLSVDKRERNLKIITSPYEEFANMNKRFR